jgi:hypothetical protein
MPGKSSVVEGDYGEAVVFGFASRSAILYRIGYETGELTYQVPIFD